MSCVYKIKTFNGITPELTENQLNTILRTLHITTDDISILVNRMTSQGFKYLLTLQEVEDKLNTLFKEEKSRNEEKLINESSRQNLFDNPINFTNAISCTRFVELMHKDFDSFASATNVDDYVRNLLKLEILMHPEMTLDEINEKKLELYNKAFMWYKQAEDGGLLHGYQSFAAFYAMSYTPNHGKYIKDFYGDKEESYHGNQLFQQLVHRFIGNSEEELLKNAIQEIDGLMRQISREINHRVKFNTDKNKYLFGKHLSAELLENELLEGVKRVGTHFDRIVIDPLGRVHIFNLKFTHTPSKKWAIAKRQKYELELAVIKQILKQNGINVNQATFVDIPVYVQYEGETDGESNQDYNIDINNPPKIIHLSAEVEDSQIINANIQSSGTYSPMAKYEPEVSKFFPKVESNIDGINTYDFSFDIDKATSLIRAVNPEFNAERSGLQISARAYIKAEKNKTINMSDDGTHWIITFPGGNKVETNTLNELELFAVINEHIQELSIKLPIITGELVKSIENSYQLGSTQYEKFGFQYNSLFLQERLSKYFVRGTNEKPRWIPLLHEQLAQVGIFLFKNVVTGTIDVVKFSALKLQEKIPTHYKFQDNILGYYEMDLEGVTKLKSSYGDMELLFTTAILNELLDKLDDVPKFGSVRIISPYYRGEAVYQDSDYAIKEFSKVVNYLNNRKDIGTTFENKFNQNNIADPIVSIIEEMEAIEQYTDINKKDLQDLKSNVDLSIFKDTKSEAAKVLGMLLIIKYIQGKWGESPLTILRKINDPNIANRVLAQIYIDAITYYTKYIGLNSVQIKHFNQFKRQVIRTDSYPDENFRLMGNLYARELDSAARDYQQAYNPVRHDILKFYDKKGFSSKEQALIGSAKGLYQKMFKRDRLNNKMLWQFVNPYNEEECKEYNLDKDEIDFLKRALFYINKSRSTAKGKEFKFTSIEDPALQTYIQNNSNTYFLVPLIRRSTNIKEDVTDWIKDKKRLFYKIINSDNINQTISELFELKDRHMIDDANKEESIYDLNVVNQIIMSEDPEGREVLLASHDDNYFETNIEYILSDYIFSHINYEHTKAVELKGKAILMRLLILSNESGPRQSKIIGESIQAIEDFLKLNVYGKSLMSESGLDFVKFMAPAKKVMTNLLIMGNLRSAFRDTFEGLMQNTVRTLTKFNTDLLTSNVYKAYGVVLKDIFNNDRTLNIVSELCLRYRLSNTDSASINERSKFGKGGITNPSYLGFSTLRGPDFLNRMTLFVARCLQDGTFYAYDLNEDDELIYDPAKDERFKIFFQGLTEHEKYKESKAAYFSAVREWNSTHNDEDKISYDITLDKLPEPYSYRDIESFKEFASMIYAAYDKYAKAGYEQLALGLTLGVFSTWFNGITAAWLREKGEYESHFRIYDEDGKLLIKHNAAGNELYFDNLGNILEKRKDGTFWNDHNEQVTGVEEEVVPVIDKVPILIQGIIGSFKDFWSVITTDGFKSFDSKFWKYQTNRSNTYRLGSDLLIMILFWIIFGKVLKPMYKEHLKNKENDNLALDLGIELLFKGGYNSFDGFFGPVAVCNYVMNDMDPSAAKLNLQLINLAMLAITGKQNWKKVIYNNMPIVRSFKDTIKMYLPESFKIPTE